MPRVHSATSDKQIRRYFTKKSQRSFTMNEMRDIYFRGRDDFSLSAASSLRAFHNEPKKKKGK